MVFQAALLDDLAASRRYVGGDQPGRCRYLPRSKPDTFLPQRARDPAQQSLAKDAFGKEEHLELTCLS